jgi:hypothetical protein
MNNEEFGYLCLYRCIDEQIHVKLKRTVHRVINIIQTRMLDGCIFLILATIHEGLKADSVPP